MKPWYARWATALPVLTILLGGLLLVVWLGRDGGRGTTRRLPGTDQAAGANPAAAINPVLAGQVVPGSGVPAKAGETWNQFRGPSRDNISHGKTSLARTWPATGPREVWSVDCGEGYAGAAVQQGRVYLMDYDAAKKQSALRCLSLADGREIWRFAYPLALKRNHGVTRTVPTLTDKYLVAMDSKCNVLCLDATSGKLLWSINLVREYGATVPQWYAGQCPLIDDNRVILAPGGPEALLLAVDLATGKPLWRTPNPRGWKMTHSSVMTMEIGGRPTYVYCGSAGVLGVSAKDGAILWESTDWKISIATVPSPLVLPEGWVLLTGGYNAGSVLLQLKETGGVLAPQVGYKLAPEVFGATQHTPILLDGNIYATRANGQFVCLSPAGEVRWTSPAGDSFGLGSFLFADGLFFILNGDGRLTLADPSAGSFHPLAQAQVLKGGESWAPMALADGLLLVRDLNRLACLDVAAH